MNPTLAESGSPKSLVVASVSRVGLIMVNLSASRDQSSTPCYLLETTRSRIKYRVWIRLNPVERKASSAIVPGNSKPYALYVNWNGKAKFNANWVDNRNQNWAAPVLRDCSNSKEGEIPSLCFCYSDFSQPPSIRPISCN